MVKSIAKGCLQFTGLFEAELLTELVLRFWEHPLANDRSFRNDLLESASEILRASVAGQRMFEELEPKNVNFVAALWHAEYVGLSTETESSPKEAKARRKWLNAVMHAVPSCFCDPKMLE